MKKFCSMLLVLCLALSMLACCAVAETTVDLTDMTVTFADGETYVFPMSVADVEAAGLSIPSDVYSLEKGYYYAGVGVSDIQEGEEEGNEFSVNVVYNVDSPETPWANGVTLTSDKNAGASVAGIVLGETTLGEPLSTTDLGDGTTTLNYNRAIMDTYTWEVVVDEATQQVIDLHIGL